MLVRSFSGSGVIREIDNGGPDVALTVLERWECLR